MTHDLHTLQPYIDGELTDAERAEVEAELARDPALRELAEQQLKIRQVLRDLPRTPAPQALRARVLLDLDAIDRENAPARAPAPAPRFARLRAFFRGAAVMVPAGAAALGLFVAARSLDRPASEPAAPQELAVRIVDVPEDSGPIRAVSLQTPRADEVVYEVGPQRIIDARGRSDGGALPGSAQLYRGARYNLVRAADGGLVVAFDAGGVRHTLREANAVAATPEQRLRALLELAHLLRASATR